MNSKCALLVALSLGSGIGCASIGTMQRAETLGSGNIQLGVEVASFGFQVEGESANAMQLDLALRYGISDRFDISARVGSSFMGVGGKIMLTPRDSDIALSLAPSVSGVAIGGFGLGAGYLSMQFPVIVGIPVGPTSQLVVAPKLTDDLVFASGAGASAGANALGAGLSVGFAAGLSDNFTLMPEFAIAQPILLSAGASAGGTGAGDSTGPRGFDFTRYQFTVGFLFGSGTPAAAEPVN